MGERKSEIMVDEQSLDGLFRRLLRLMEKFLQANAFGS